MENWSKKIIEYQNPTIENIVSQGVSDIDTVSHVLKIDPNYLSVQVRLHLPFFSQAALENDKAILIIRGILSRLRNSLQGYEECYLRHQSLNGIDSIPDNSKLIGSEPYEIFDENDNVVNKLEFRYVEKEVGLEIQNRLHYIHNARVDTKYHFGLFLPDKNYPICYAALSECARDYQAAGIGHIMQLNKEKIVVMTRAFGFTKLPKNTMSKFFQRITKEILSEKKYLVIITALNPLLGFKGSIFLGSSYIPYMLSPLEYHYNERGLYATRRALNKNYAKQKMKTPPIIWLARGIKSRIQRKIESNETLKPISKEEYQNG